MFKVDERSRNRCIAGCNFSTHSIENKLKNVPQMEKKENQVHMHSGKRKSGTANNDTEFM